MNKVNFKLSNGEELSVSTILMGSGDFLKLDNMEIAEKVLNRYVELGGNTFDTARHYRHSEKALGHWMEKNKNRELFNIETKCCHPVREARDTPRVNAQAIDEDIQTSLEYLKTDHVEFLALHRDDPNVPVGPLMEELNRQVELKRVRAIGVSNWELPRIIEAQNYCIENHIVPLSFNSPNLSLATINKPRWENCVTANEDMKNWHEEEQFPLIAWSSQAEGFFANRFNKNDLSNEEIVDVYYNEQNWRKLERVNQLAKEKGYEPIQISLAYVLNQNFPICAVIGPETINELESSIEASQIKLTAKEMDWLNLK
ncbi:aldo/keto reductase [Tetragenococcus halophilus]|uniref:aldo/keto reductase n=1 Tax=Tetragenococcus halophilus TaxID=51669 RepID=UPI00300FCFF2